MTVSLCSVVHLLLACHCVVAGAADLFAASDSGDTVLVSTLLSSGGADVNAKSPVRTHDTFLALG